MASITRKALADLVIRYFRSVDTGDIPDAISLFAPDAVFTVESDHVTFTGRAVIQSMLTSFSERSTLMEHRNRNIVIDEATRKVATEQRYVGELHDGTTREMVTCNFFDVGVDGRFARVAVWMAGPSPLGDGRT
ncbi:hypothetical protein BO83DRAFT_383813 [Aspergillus eucalypticola CBS 122712]|uniref:SnoaL-like domain-containing protein n=1 Tax=Aspergillus eucalypticola (strain CBS 122712 / IBT 29274) TaxID=1448314 RepID=A0A317UJ61_ASPEC|nr:uncharacterized protein BO83DRAFT_383813 [Aspergillus eucalypticola CBS 122712]PWY61711.1 hypothetical protein BO83DRAFT_383813 [Aspergillus eucalypticola CBS 122712]